MDLTAASTLFALSKSYQEWTWKDKKTRLSRSLALLTGFGAVYREEESKLPFQLNLLDDLKINENAHSKFLIRILAHKPALIHFLQFLYDKRDFRFDTGKIKNPILTAEKMRMDGLIREQKEYAIIIENKIHGASEQQHQIARYIDKCEKVGFAKHQIYVIYLTKFQDEAPTEQIWGDNYTQEAFHTRYIKISYHSEILPWIETYAATLPPKEELFKGALIQYADHIKSVVNIPKDREKMNHELRHFLSQELGLAGNQPENIRILQEKFNEINELSSQMKQLLDTSKKELFIGWKNELERQFNLETFEQTNDNFFKTGVKVSHNGKPFSVLIEHNLRTGEVYYGMGRHHVGNELDTDIMEFLSPLKKKESFIEYPLWWYGLKNTSFEYGYKDLEDLIELVIEHIQQPVEQNNIVSSDH